MIFCFNRVEVLGRSQLPALELQELLRMADVDGDGQLHFGEFAAALHLTALRRSGEPLPEHLPAPLLQLAQGSTAPELEHFNALFDEMRLGSLLTRDAKSI